MSDEAQRDAFLRELLDDARATSAWSRQRELRLVNRILQRTTREDLGWRGELRLVGAYVADRLGGSRALRVLAASLLLHLLAGPFFAWWIYRETREPEYTIGYISAEDHAFSDDEPLEVPPVEPEEVVLDPDELEPGPAPERIENAVRLARFQLCTRRLVVCVPPGEPPSAEIRLLAARSRWIDERAWPSFLDDPQTLERADLVQAALLTDLLLDRWILSGERASLTSAALERLERELADGGGQDSLAALALARARAYGVWRAPRGFDPLACPAPFGGAWLERLRGALDRAGQDPALVELR
jgi:hypothetical protein